jgi:hypothetical protein
MFTFPFTQMGGNAPDVAFLGMTVAASASGLSIGPGRPDRIVVVAAQKEQDASGAFATPTINGTAATIIVQPAISDPLVMGYAFVPSGTTVNLACSAALRICGWVLTGVSALNQTLTGAVSGADYTITGTMPAQPSVILGIARSRSTESSYSASVSGVLRDVATDAYSTSGSGASSWIMAHAQSDGPGAGTLVMTGSNSYSSGYGAAAVFI